MCLGCCCKYGELAGLIAGRDDRPAYKTENHPKNDFRFSLKPKFFHHPNYQSLNIIVLLWPFTDLFIKNHRPMKTHRREILIYYNPDSSNDRKTVAHAQSLAPHIRTYAFDKAPSTGTSWQQIITALSLHPKELLDKSKPYYQQHIRGREFNEQDWLNVIINNPSLLKAPIAVRGDRAIMCSNATDIYKLTVGESVTFF
jgi:arsenate reductase